MGKIPKEKLVKIIKSLLATDADLDFLLQLDGTDIETLVDAIRNRAEGVGNST